MLNLDYRWQKVVELVIRVVIWFSLTQCKQQCPWTKDLKHHQKYTDSLNGALAKLRADAATKHLAKMGVDTLLQHLAEIPDEATRRTVQNAGGGYLPVLVLF